MSFHIYQFSNLSPKSVLLTNPASPRDTHLLPMRGFMEPEYPPLINFLKASEITLDRYDLLLKKALNIYQGRTTGVSGISVKRIDFRCWAKTRRGSTSSSTSPPLG
jgi:hypothetical protein